MTVIKFKQQKLTVNPNPASSEVRIRGLRSKKNNKGRCPLFRSPPFSTIVVPRPNPLVEADAVRQYIVSCYCGAPRRSPAR
jgi:hypothetical protein